jgi:hypothetical protein
MRDEKVPFLDLVTVHRGLQDEFVDILKTALSTAGFIGGPMVQGFEQDFAQFCETRFCVGVGSVTDALRFALIAAGNEALRSSLLRRGSHFGYEGRKLRGYHRTKTVGAAGDLRRVCPCRCTYRSTVCQFDRSPTVATEYQSVQNSPSHSTRLTAGFRRKISHAVIALEHLHNPSCIYFRMRTAKQMDMMFVRANRYHLDRKPFRNLGSRLLDDRRHRLMQQCLALFHRKDNVVVDLPRTVRSLSDRLVPLVRHAPEGTREPYPRSKLRGMSKFKRVNGVAGIAQVIATIEAEHAEQPSAPTKQAA